jgi:hypothetical protein
MPTGLLPPAHRVLVSLWNSVLKLIYPFLDRSHWQPLLQRPGDPLAKS